MKLRPSRHYTVQAQNAQNPPSESPFSPTIPMSTNNQVSSISTSNFAPIFRAACDEYKTLTGQDLYTHPFAQELDHCDSADSILNVLREQAQVSLKRRKDHEKLVASLNPVINVLFTFSATLGEGIGLVRISSLLHLLSLTSVSQPCSPGKTIFTGIGVLLGVCLPLFPHLRLHNILLRR